jgi:predicted ester cyclase
LEARAIADTYLRTLNTRDADLVDVFLAEDYINHNVVVAVGLPDVAVTMEDFIVSGDRIVGRFVYRGTHTGELMGIAPTGKRVEMRSIDIWRIDGGLAVEHWDELNLLEVFQQIGVLPQIDGAETDRA